VHPEHGGGARQRCHRGERERQALHEQADDARQGIRGRPRPDGQEGYLIFDEGVHKSFKHIGRISGASAGKLAKAGGR